MKNCKRLTLAILTALGISSPVSAFPGKQWEMAAQVHGLDPVLLYSVALAESAAHRGLNMTSPWPYAIRMGTQASYAKDEAEATALLERMMDDAPGHQLDIGLMQINWHWHGHRVESPVQLLDAETNLAVGAQILAEAIKSAPGDRVLGIGRYHSWQEERSRWYGERVLSIYHNILKELESRP